MWAIKNPSKQAIPSQMYPDASTRDAIGTRSRILADAPVPMPFMALPRNTFPRGPKMILTRIRGIVFSWSLRVCVTYLLRPEFQNIKKSPGQDGASNPGGEVQRHSGIFLIQDRILGRSMESRVGAVHLCFFRMAEFPDWPHSNRE